MKKITLEIPDGKKAEWINGVLTLIDEKDNRPITERVKNWDDVVRELGYAPIQVLDDVLGVKEDKSLDDNAVVDKDLIAYLKIRAITTVLNEGWTPQFTKDERRYFPYFYLYTKEDYAKLDLESRSRVVLRSSSHAVALGGVAFAVATDDSSYASTYYGSRLAFKSRDLAVYAGKTFTREYADFVFPERQNPQENDDEEDA